MCYLQRNDSGDARRKYIPFLHLFFESYERTRNRMANKKSHRATPRLYREFSALYFFFYNYGILQSKFYILIRNKVEKHKQ